MSLPSSMRRRLHRRASAPSAQCSFHSLERFRSARSGQAAGGVSWIRSRSDRATLGGHRRRSPFRGGAASHPRSHVTNAVLRKYSKGLWAMFNRGFGVVSFLSLFREGRFWRSLCSVRSSLAWARSRRRTIFSRLP